MSRHDFYKFMADLKVAIAGDYERIAQRAREDPGTAGDQVEERWAQLLRDWLPSNYPVVTKGRLLFPDKSSSGQVDVLVLRPSYPNHLRSQKYYFSGGVVAVFECKLTLKKQHVKDFFKITAEIKKKSSAFGEKSRVITPYGELFTLPIVGLVSHSHVWHPEDPSHTIYKKIAELENQFAEHPRELPDIICVADTATFVMDKVINAGKNIPLDILQDIGAHGLEEAISVMYTIMDERVPDGFDLDTKGKILASLVFSVTRWMAREDESLRSWADHLEAALQVHLGIGRPTFWPADILPQAVLRKIRRNGFNADRWNPWNDWV